MSGNTEKKKGKGGRPRERPTGREEAQKKANQILSDYLAGGTGETEGAVRRRINRLGENPDGGQWFSYSHIGTNTRIVDITRPSYSSPNSSSSLSTSGVSRRTLIEGYEENEENEENEEYEEGEENEDDEIVYESPARSSLIPPSSGRILPEIYELQNSGVEIPTGIENMNQNIPGINERGARDDDYNDWYDRTTARIVRNINAPPFERFEIEERDIDLEQMDDDYDREILNEPSGSELENTDRFMARNSFSSDRPYRGAPRPSGSVGDPRPSIESFPMSYAPMRSLVTERLQQMFGELGMQIPPEIQTMGVEALEGLMRDSGIKLNMDDVKNALSESGIENFESSLLPFSGLIESASNRLGIRNPFSRGFGAVRSITETLPEDIRKKVTEAGGSMIDARFWPRPTSPADSSIREAASTASAEARRGSPSGVHPTGATSNIFGRTTPRDGGDDPGDSSGGGGGNESKVPKATKDPRDYLIDQINSINLRLEDVSRGAKLSYPEAKKITPYRFPRADENYNAVRLVQNATTNYLNDLNLYGTSFDNDI